jgi:hypothetical protein
MKRLPCQNSFGIKGYDPYMEVVVNHALREPDVTPTPL